MDPRYAVLRIDDVATSMDFGGLRFRPLRPLLGIEAFGVAGWVADAGEAVIVDHTEPPDGQEEFDIVLAGRARFAIGDDEELTASPGRASRCALACAGRRPPKPTARACSRSARRAGPRTRLPAGSIPPWPPPSTAGATSPPP
ncbi:MAG TPA: hypothetical protein VHS27_05950 [Gaiellales bacterium]|nr:hypothetical protein [Gaiellales bacterium]